MVTLVVVINLAIALILLYVAWRVWLIRLKLAQVANTLIRVERSTHQVLGGAPDAISITQQNIHRLQQGNEPLQLQLQRVRQVLSLLVFGRQVAQRFSRSSPLLKQPFTKSR